MLSQYRLAEKIGEGGMGVVWKAIDTTLGREVAIKVLPDIFAADPERLARFEREAKLLASLNHSGIATIHGLHHAEGVRFLAMEFLPGIDLSQRIAQGPIPLDEALAIGRDVAGALEAAHENGVIHRDLKPANIHLGPDGRVKVLDFGLAKAFEPDSISSAVSHSPTVTTPATRAGVIMGTAAYMSPEQAKGRPVDRRADIWAFGCVLYEMLTGKRPFSGDGVSELLAAVIMGPANLQAIPATVPAPVRRLIRRSLDKDPRKRLRDIGDARLVIEEVLAGKLEESETAVPAPAPAAKGRSAAPLLIAGIVLGILAGAGTLWIARPRSAPAPLRRFELPAQGPFRSPIVGSLVAISPEGLRVAYGDQGKLYIRTLDQIEPKVVATAADPTFLFWSPDGAWLAYAAAGKIWKVAAEGGESKIVVDQPGELTGGTGGTWGPKDTIVFTRGEDAVYEVPATGGDVKTLLHVNPGEGGDFHQPSFLPDGSGVLLIYHPRGQTPNTLSLLAGGVRVDLLKLENQQFGYPTYSGSGHILYRRQPTNPGIWALPFSLSKHEVTGEPFLVVPDGDVESVSSDGTMAYVKGGVSRMTQLAWIDRNGKTVGTVGKPQEQWPFPALSPDGRRVAVAAAENEKRDLWIDDVERGTMTRLTFDMASTWSPAWTPRGDTVVYTEGTSPPFKIFSKAADGTGEPKPIAEGWGVAVSPDGKYLTYAIQDPNTDWDLWYQDLEKNGAPVSLLKTSRTQTWAQISPDGRYYAYESDETGRDEIYLKRFPTGEGKWQVSVDGGDWPRWNRKGTKIYYARGDDILEAAVSTSQALALGKPQVAVTRPPLGMPLMFGWPPGFDVSADEQRFLLCLGVGGKKIATGIVVVENWLAEFNRKK